MAIARALVKQPDVLLLDEPLSNLDARLRMEMRQEVRRIQLESKVTTVFVTHDQEEAMSITDTIVLMKKGVVQQQAPAREIYMNPNNAFVASFLGNPPISFLDAKVAGGQVALDAGQGFSVSGVADGAYSLGIRPEAWVPGHAFHVKVEHVEMRGQDQIVTFKLNGVQVRATLDAEYQANVGETISLDLRTNRCYFFNPETGVRV